MDQIIDWVYGQVVGFLGDFFSQMGSMGVELFDMPWVQSIVLFFNYLGWTLFAVGLVVSTFETGIDYQNGRGSVKDALLNALKGFLAVNLFTIVPVELFKLSVNLQASLTSGITGYVVPTSPNLRCSQDKGKEPRTILDSLPVSE